MVINLFGNGAGVKHGPPDTSVGKFYSHPGAKIWLMRGAIFAKLSGFSYLTN